MYGQLEPGTIVGHYRIGQLLGSGGMGAVYLAEHLTLRTSVALKVLRPDLAQDPDFRERFLREARSAASLDHPNIVPVYDAGEGGGSLFIAMRYVEGTDLARVLGAEGDLDPARAIAILRQVAEALDEAHRNGLVHRDVKPANILIAAPTATRTGERAYLTDFGLVKPAADPGLTGGGMFIGTRDYVAPELLMSNDADARADQYGLTCVLFQSLTGSVPFPRDFDAAVITAHLAMEPPPVAALHPGLPPALDDVIGRGMAKDRERRFRDCVALIDAAAAALGVGPPARLDRHEADLAPSAVPPSAPTQRTPRPRASALVAAGLALVLIAGATAWFLTRGEPVAVTACGSAAGDLEGRLRADGGTIAFVSDRGGDRDLYLMDVATAAVRQLTTDPGTDGNPTWSPDGSRLAFDSDRDGDFDIYVMNADGSGLQRLVGDPGADVSPAWSPDGRSIAFSSTRDGNNEIYVVDVATGKERRVTSNVGHDGQPTWSPDGRSIAFSSDRTGNQEIFVMNVDGTAPRNLTRSASTDLKPAWSPDGTSIAFTSDRDGDVDVYLMDPTGTNTRQLTLNDAVDGYPSWSPDGAWLLYDTPVQGATDICALPVEGGGGVDLTSDSAALDAVTSWTSRA